MNWLDCGRTVLLLQVSWHGWIHCKENLQLATKKIFKVLEHSNKVLGLFFLQDIYTHLRFFIWNLYFECYITVNVWLSKFLWLITDWRWHKFSSVQISEVLIYHLYKSLSTSPFFFFPLLYVHTHKLFCFSTFKRKEGNSCFRLKQCRVLLAFAFTFLPGQHFLSFFPRKTPTFPH